MWNTFAAVSGGAAGGLTGLIFIVVSFRYQTLAVSEEYRSRAAQTLALFLTVTVVAVLITVPQHDVALGTEMVLVALVCGTLLRSLDGTARRSQTTRPSAALVGAFIVFIACIGVSGLLVALGQEWGRYLYVVSAVDGLVCGAYGAWTFLTRAGNSTTESASVS